MILRWNRCFDRKLLWYRLDLFFWKFCKFLMEILMNFYEILMRLFSWKKFIFCNFKSFQIEFNLISKNALLLFREKNLTNVLTTNLLTIFFIWIFFWLIRFDSWTNLNKSILNYKIFYPFILIFSRLFSFWAFHDFPFWCSLNDEKLYLNEFASLRWKFWVQISVQDRDSIILRESRKSFVSWKC